MRLLCSLGEGSIQSVHRERGLFTDGSAVVRERKHLGQKGSERINGLHAALQICGCHLKYGISSIKHSSFITQCSFLVQRLFEGSVYSRAAFN